MDLREIKRHSGRDNSIDTPGKRWLEAIYQLAKQDIKFAGKLNDKHKERFFSETAILLSSGVDLQTVLQLSISSVDKKGKIHDIYKQLLTSVSTGSSMASAMENTGFFNNFDCYSVKIGENTGDLAIIFKKLSTYYNKKITQRRKILSALSYPIVILATTTGAVFFMLKFVVPMFANTLEQFGGELPPITQFIITLSDNIYTILLVFATIIVAILFLFYRNKGKVQAQRIFSKFLLRLPYIGQMIRKSYLVQFTQAMELLLAARVDLVESIQLTCKMISFYPLNAALENVRTDVLKGNFFYESMERQSFFDNTMVTLVKIGEEVNKLDKIFMELNSRYESELEYRSNIFITVLEPLMILLLAAVVGTILIAMYLPMFKIGTAIH